MSDFVEKITLDLDGTAVDGSAAAGLRNTGEGVSGLLGDLNKLQDSTGAEATLGKIGAAVDNTVTSLLKMAGAFVGFEALKALAGDMLGAVKEHENLTLTIAATMVATNGWSNSISIARVQLEKLKEIAALVNGNETQMVDTFNLLKRTFGGTSDQAVALTGNLALLARQYNTTADTLATRLAMAGNTGNLMPRGVAGIALTSTGIDATELQLMKDAGQAMEYLNAKITGNQELVDQLKNTWSYLTAELAKLKNEALETIGSGFEPLKAVLKSMAADLQSLESQQSFQHISNAIKALSGVISDLVGNTQANVPLWLQALEKMVEGTASAVARMTAGWQSYKIITEAFGVSVLGATPEERMGAFTNMEKQLDALTVKVNATIAKITSIPSAVQAAGDRVAADFARVAGAEKPTPPSPGKDVVQAAKDDSDEIAAIVQDNWNKVNAYNETGLAKELALEEATTAKEIAALELKFVTDKEFIDARLSYTALAAVKEQALNFASQAKNDAEIEKQRQTLVDKNEWILGETKKLNDELAAVTDNYYTKEQANIQKAYDAEVRQIDRRLGVGTDAAEIEIALADKVRVARLALSALEENSIIGFRKTMEDNAALLVKTTDSVAGGYAAGMATIMASAKSTTESTRDYIVGVWGAVTTGIGNVLLTIETGTGSLLDELKSLYSSVLQSFNTMIVEMVKRWVLGLGQMKDASSGSGGLSSLFAGAGVASSIDAQGNVVYHGGTINTVTKGQGTQGVVTQQQPQGVGLGSVIGGAAAGASMFSSTGGSGFAQVVGTVGGAALGGGLAAIGAALIAGIEIPVLGWIAAAVGVILIGLSALLKPNTETSIFGRDFAPQIKAVGEGIQSSLVEVFATSLLPDAAGFAKSLNDRIKTYLQSANFFEVHAGSSEDITKDIQTLLSGIIPTELLHTLIGQQRTGGQDVAGISGASTYGGMLAPDAPINKMLTDLGFTADKVQQLAGQIDTMAPADWMKMLSGLVSVVAGSQALGKQLSLGYDATIAGIDAEAAKSPAGKLADRLTGVTDLLKAVSFYTGTEQITKGQEALAAAQQFYADAKTAMAQLSAMSKQITQDAADSTKKVLDAIKSPAELAAQSVADLGHDYERMRFAANPEDLASAWAKARTDFEAVAGEMVTRIKQIRTVLDDIHTLQAAMATGPGPSATADPLGWLSLNTAHMAAYKVAMDAATPGSTEQIAAATSYAGLIRDRYQMEIAYEAQLTAMVQQVRTEEAASIKSVLDSLKTPAELFAQSGANLQTDYQAIRDATDATGMAAAWASAKADFTAVATELVNRIKAIGTLLADIHTLQDSIANGPAINAQTDPQAWLAQNTINMEKYRVAMLAASPGSPEELAAATSMVGLIRDRYTMELDMLARVKSVTEAIDQSIGASLTQLQMQGMGKVVNGVWTPDVHAQGQFMLDQITALQGQLGTAQTPEAVQQIVNQIQALVGQLGGQAQDPAHYAESLKVLAQILKDTQTAADARLKGIGAAATFDISTLGPKLAAAETIMADALKKVQTDLDALVFHFKSAADEVARKLKAWGVAIDGDIAALGTQLAGAETIMSNALTTVTGDLQTLIDDFGKQADFATGKFHDWGVEISDQLNALGPELTDMVKNFTDVNTALSGAGGGGGGGGGGGKGPVIPLGDNLTGLGSGVSDARGALVDFTATVKDATAALGGKAA